MKLKTVALASALLTALIAAPAFAAPDVYVVNFRHAKDAGSQQLDAHLEKALTMARVNAEEVVIDTTTAAKWEKGAYDAFHRDLVPVFNKWVGLPGFAVIVDASNKEVIGCVTPDFEATEIAQELRAMASMAKGDAVTRNASTNSKTTQCPAAHNEPLRK